MSIALAPGLDPITGFRCVRRLGRSPRGETWLVHTEDDSHRVLKLLYQGKHLQQARKLTNYRHPFLLNWERCHFIGDDLILLTDWTEETVEAEYQRHRENGQPGIPREPLLRYVEELAEVLDYLHVKHRLVHGRLKLSQVGLQHGHIKLLDWGLTQAEQLFNEYWSLDLLLTTAPEVLLGEIEPASDQFSLAALFLQACTGCPPLPVKNLPEFFQLRRGQSFDPHLLRDVEVPVFQRAMHLDPASRFPTCAAFVKSLQLAQQGDKSAGTVTSPVQSDTVATALPGLTEVSTWNPPPSSAAGKDHEQGHVPTVILKSLMEVESSHKDRHPDSAFLNLNNLAYHSKVQSAGILTPTLIIGLGRTGATVLHETCKLMHKRLDGINSLPHLRILAVDDQDHDDPSLITSKPGSLLKEQFFHCPLPDTATTTLSKDPTVASWLPQSKHNQVDTVSSARGRLSLVSRLSEFRRRLQEECKLMLQSESLMQSKQLTGLPIRQDLTPTFYVVGSLEEGFSAGTLADIAGILRSVIQETGWGHCHVHGLFFLPHDQQPEHIKAQAYATLVELNHYTQENHFSAHYDSSHEITSTHQPYDLAFFRKFPIPEEATAEEPVTLSAAHWLLRDVITVLGSLRQASRDSTRSYASHTTPWYGHGMTALFSSHQQIHALLKNRLRGKLLGHWLRPEPELEHAIRGEGDLFIEQNIFTAGALLSRFQHLVAIVLGREPAHMIEEWVAPLRKGAAARPPLETLARDIMQKVEYTFGAGTGYQNSPAMVAVQQEAESIAHEIAVRIEPYIMQYLDKPGLRLGAALVLCRHILDWVNHHLNELQASHMEIHQDMLRSERTMTQMMSQEERSFAIMGRQRLVSQIAQDLMDYPSRVLKEDMFARAVHVFQHIKKAIEDVYRKLHPAELTLQKLYAQYLSPSSLHDHLLLDGEQSLDDRVDQLIQLLPEDAYVRMDADLSEAMGRFQTNYTSVCLGQGPSFNDVLDLIDTSLEECMEGLLPSEDAAEQLMALSSQAVVELLRQSYRDARPDLMDNKRSRQGAFCLMLTPDSDAGQELLQMAQATLPQIVAAPEGEPNEILMYRETGCLLPHEIYPQGQQAYEALCQKKETSPHSRFDITFWHALASPSNTASAPTLSSYELHDIQ